MEKSKYNLEVQYENGLIIYNTLSGAVIRLDSVHSKIYNNPLTWSLYADFVSNMKRGNFIVPDGIDEFELILNTSKLSRKESKTGVYTIAPTLECNFRCPYCFEPSHQKNRMTDERAIAVSDYIKRDIESNNYEGVEVTWYGGEPLLALPIIESISLRIMNLVDNYIAGIITNGYYLNKEVSQKLKQLSITYAQITIDGPPEIHNKRRCLPSGKDTFYKILNNIVEACNNIDIVIRVNVDKGNVAAIDRIIDILDKFDLRNRISVYLAPVENINGAYSNLDLCMENVSFSEFEAEFAKRHCAKGYIRPHLPGFNPSICGAVCNWSTVIDPKGDLYKCWNEIDIPMRSYGSIYSDKSNDNLSAWLNYSPEEFNDCKECVFLPLCMGGCPYERIHSSKNHCMSIKENYKSMLELLAKQHS